jgi:glycosyltransferase involved in cell wall biosynthesis
MKHPRISIVTPTYNRAGFLEDTIRSVVNQNYPNLEYIIIDGGSTDGTVEIIKKYDKQLAFWVSEPDKGMYHAIQKGFDRATGDILAWINSDDMYHPNSLFVVAEIFKNKSFVSWIVGTPTLFNRDGQCVKVFPTIRWSKRKFFSGDNKWIQQESVFFRKSLWENTGSYINTKYLFAADFELWVRFFRKTQLYSVNTILGGFRQHHDQLSITNTEKYLDESKEIIKSYKNDLSDKKLIFILSLLCNLKNHCLKSSVALIRKLGLYFTSMLNKLYCLPGIIYYDFENSIWR